MVRWFLLVPKDLLDHFRKYRSVQSVICSCCTAIETDMTNCSTTLNPGYHSNNAMVSKTASIRCRRRRQSRGAPLAGGHHFVSLVTLSTQIPNALFYMAYLYNTCFISHKNLHLHYSLVLPASSAEITSDYFFLDV